MDTLLCVQRRNLRYGTTTVAYYGSTSVDSNIELVRAVGKYPFVSIRSLGQAQEIQYEV